MPLTPFSLPDHPLRDGKGNFSRRSLSKILDIDISLAILEHIVHLLTLAPRTSSFLIFPVPILLPSTTVIVLHSLCHHGTSCSVRGGSQPLFHVLKPSLHLTVSKPSMNSLCKGRRAYMTTTILSYGDQITPISQIRL